MPDLRTVDELPALRWEPDLEPAASPEMRAAERRDLWACGLTADEMHTMNHDQHRRGVPVTTEEQSIKPTLGEEITELYSRVAKLNDQTAAILAPAWGSENGIIPTDHPLYVAEKPPTAQQEQAAPVDWQAIAEQRERELKQVGEARHRAEVELARLREGEEDSYDPRTVPTPGQWIHQFNQAPATKRLEVVAATIEAAEKGRTCFLMAHEKRLEAAEAAIARIRTFASRARDHTAVGADDYQIGQHDLAVDLLTALDGPAPARGLAATRAADGSLYDKISGMFAGPLPPPGDTPPATVLKCSHAHLRQPHAPHRWQPQPGMRHVQCPGWEHVPAATRAADRPETDYDRLIAAGSPADHAARYAENGIATPGCDCGHDGMGEAWHGTTCIWRAFRKAAPAATEATSGPDTITDPEWLRQQYASVIRRWWDADDGGAEEIAAAVLGVRDRHLDQLRQRLQLADSLHRNQLDQPQERP